MQSNRKLLVQNGEGYLRLLLTPIMNLLQLVNTVCQSEPALILLGP